MKTIVRKTVFFGEHGVEAHLSGFILTLNSWHKRVQSSSQPQKSEAERTLKGISKKDNSRKAFLKGISSY